MTKQELQVKIESLQKGLQCRNEEVERLRQQLELDKDKVSIPQELYNQYLGIHNDIIRVGEENMKLKSEVIEMGRTIHEQAKTINKLLSKYL